MSRLRYKRDGVRAGEEAIQSYREQIATLQQERDEIAQKKQGLFEQYQNEASNMAMGLLPYAEQATVSAAAAKLKFPALTVKLREQHEQLQRNKAEKGSIEEVDDWQQREILIHPTTGTLTEERNVLDEHIKHVKNDLAPYNNKNFELLYSYKDQPEPSGLRKFGMQLTGRARRLRKAEEEILAKKGFKTKQEAFMEYESQTEELKRNLDLLDALNARIENIQALNQRYGELTHHIDNFPQLACAHLRQEVVNYLTSSYTLKEIRDGITNGVRLHMSTLLALREKMNYLDELDHSLGQEQGDRKKHINKIQKVLPMWRNKPHDYLRGDKSKWLVGLPEQKRQKTAKVSNWSRTVHYNVYEYDNYYAYDRALDAYTSVLLFDMIAHSAADRMPYAGYVHHAMPSTAMYHNEYGTMAFDDFDFDEGYNDGYDDGYDGGYDGDAYDEAVVTDEEGVAIAAAAEGLDEAADDFSDES